MEILKHIITEHGREIVIVHGMAIVLLSVILYQIRKLNKEK